MLIGKAPEFKSSEITPREKFLNRRTHHLRWTCRCWARLRMAPEDAASLYAHRSWPPPNCPLCRVTHRRSATPSRPRARPPATTTFYEFGTDKADPKANAGKMHTRPWTVKIDGLVNNPKTLDIDSLMRYKPLQDRTYRFRCVEAWSMIIPWVGYPLSELIRFADPKPEAKFIEFYSLADRSEMVLPGGFDWPYTEGLRMDEAMHPLTLLTFGSYGQTLENQQGAPVRVIIPWKYGFKSAKSIVRIKFTDKQPVTTWNDISSQEYGFYANVNPNHDHPRWSQAHERRIDTSVFPHTVSDAAIQRLRE